MRIVYYIRGYRILNSNIVDHHHLYNYQLNKIIILKIIILEVLMDRKEIIHDRIKKEIIHDYINNLKDNKMLKIVE